MMTFLITFLVVTGLSIIFAIKYNEEWLVIVTGFLIFFSILFSLLMPVREQTMEYSLELGDRIVMIDGNPTLIHPKARGFALYRLKADYKKIFVTRTSSLVGFEMEEYDTFRSE